MNLRSALRKKLIKAEFEEVFRELGDALNGANLQEEYRTLTLVQTTFNQHRKDKLRNTITQHEYEVNIARITNSVLELLQLLPDNTGDSRGRLKELIRRLDIESGRIGALYMVNCDRKRLADHFWDRFDEKIDTPFQLYFLPASPVQMPPSFAERMIWEILTEELEEELDSLSMELKPSGVRLKTADFTIKNNLRRTQKAFKKYFCKRFQATDFERLIAIDLPQKGYKYVATIIRIELKEWKDFVPAFLEWVLQTFKEMQNDSTTFLFFNVIYMRDFIDEPRHEEQKKVLETIRSIIDRNKNSCTVLRGFTPVPGSDLENWFRKIGEHNPNRVADIIESMLNVLPPEKRTQYRDSQHLDMVDIEELQEIVYEVANEH